MSPADDRQHTSGSRTTLYGTVAHITVKPGHMDDVVSLCDEWRRNLKPTLPGAVNSYVYRFDADQNRIAIVAVFQDKASYVGQADHPAQGEWFGRVSAHFDGETQWNDGELIMVA